MVGGVAFELETGLGEDRRQVEAGLHGDPGAPAEGVESRFQRAVEDLASARHHDDGFAQSLGMLHDMGGKQHRRAGGMLLADDLLQRLLVDRVEA